MKVLPCLDFCASVTNEGLGMLTDKNGFNSRSQCWCGEVRGLPGIVPTGLGGWSLGLIV